MSDGLLPGTRPVSNNYGQDLENERPVEDPTRELDAADWNRLKGDLAYAARMTPLLKIRVANNGTATVAEVIGPEGVTIGQVTATRDSLGVVTVDWTDTGVVGSDVHSSCRHATTAGVTFQRALSPTSVEVTTLGPANSPTFFDSDFTLWVF